MDYIQILSFSHFVIIYFIFALVFSLFYGYYAFEIHNINKTDLGDLSKLLKRKSYDKQPRSWKVHQFWFNFFGCFAGWCALAYIIFIRLNYFQNISSLEPLTLIDVIIFITAMVGITGYFPFYISQIGDFIHSFSKGK